MSPRDAIRSTLSHHAPGLLNAIRTLRQTVMDRVQSPRDVFVKTYRAGGWGAAESVSGPGSVLAATVRVRSELPELLTKYSVKRLLDAPCGDFNWMQHVALDCDYTGVDVVPDLIAQNERRYSSERRRFIAADVTQDPLPAADLVLCRDCFIHLSYRRIFAAIKGFRRTGATYLLATHNTDVAENYDILTGSFRPLNLERAPFNFPAPIDSLFDGDSATGAAAAGQGRRLALWRFSDLP